MSKTLSLTPRAQTSDKKSTTKRTPVRGHNRNNHALKAKVTTTNVPTEKPESKFKSDQSKQSSAPFSKSEHSSKKGSDRFTAKTASNDASAKPTGRTSNKPNNKSAAKPAQTVLRHGKMRDGVREFADGRVVPSKRRDRNADDLVKKQDSNNPKQKTLHHEAGVVRKTQNTQTTQSTEHSNVKSSKFNRARLPESTASGIRISKYLADQGLCSRREADAYIEKGWVTVNGKRAELGQRIQPTDRVQLARQASLTQAERVTILINKPVGYVSGQAEDGYEPAVSLINADNQWVDAPFQQKFEFKHLKGLAPAGRLDIDSVGLLVLTQDGRVAKQLIGEDSEIDKEYLVRVEGELIENGLKLLNHGLELDGVALRPAKVSWQNEDQLRFVLREGKKRQIRRMCELVGLKVVGLKRIRIGNVKLGNLPTGQWRYLAADEGF